MRFPNPSDTARLVSLVLSVLLSGMFGMPARAQTTDAPSLQETLPIRDGNGTASLPVLVSRDLSQPQPDITRAVITIHGRDRNAGTYDAIAHEALQRAGDAGKGTLLLTPRFADAGDADLPVDALRWHGGDWMAGGAAEAPSAITSFAALDALVSLLADRSMFPNLRTVVIAGHSGGGQLVQRYAVLGHEPPAATAEGIQVRFLVANPSSYSYFTADRPDSSGGFAPFPTAQCPRFDDWKYGMHDLPPYASNATAAALERDYVQQDVTYLLGGEDTNPDLPALDKSCAAEAQGPNHLQRGLNFFRYLRMRHPIGLNQYEYEVPGIGHDARGMLLSDCALATMFGAPLCGAEPKPVALPTLPATAPVPAPSQSPALPPLRHAPRRAPPPPIPRHRPVEHRALPRAGWIWQPGSWSWNGETYVWVPGHHVRPVAPVARFVPPSWQFDGVGWVWVPAHWRVVR